jgi:hypothetical protein
MYLRLVSTYSAFILISTYLCARIEHQSTEGRKDDSHNEEQGQDSLGGEDRSEVRQWAVARCFESLLTAMLLTAVAGTQYLSKGSVFLVCLERRVRILAGRRVFGFFSSPSLPFPASRAMIHCCM